MRLSQQADAVASRENLASFVASLRSDLEARPDQWENPTLDRFLEAMESWISAMDQAYLNNGKQPPLNPSWQTFAEILYAARIYE